MNAAAGQFRDRQSTSCSTRFFTWCKRLITSRAKFKAAISGLSAMPPNCRFPGRPGQRLMMPSRGGVMVPPADRLNAYNRRTDLSGRFGIEQARSRVRYEPTDSAFWAVDDCGERSPGTWIISQNTVARHVMVVTWESKWSRHAVGKSPSDDLPASRARLWLWRWLADFIFFDFTQ